MKINDNYIIPPSDKRYGKLGHLWKKYNWDNVVLHEGPRRIYYYIPPELVLHDYNGYGFCVKQNPTHPDHNYVSRFAIERMLNDCCLLNSQTYFDLLILHINRVIDRPRCVNCKKFVPWGSRITWGYNQTYFWPEVRFTYCSDSCAKQYQSHHPEHFPEQAEQINTWMKQGWKAYAVTKAAMHRYIGLGDKNDQVQFYVTYMNDGRFKFGLTLDLDMRSRHEWLNGNDYVHPRTLVILDRVHAAYLEAIIKLKFDGREYLDSSEVHEFFSIYKSELVNQPFANPFE